MCATAPSAPALVALDWGTTSLRAWLLDSRGGVLDATRAPRGIMQIPDGDFARAMAEVADRWPDLPAIAAGMIGSSQGWLEAPYLACPASLDDLAEGLVPVPGTRLWIVPGIRRPAALPDVMRGEETQIAGALALRPDLTAGARCVLPGTHSKWAEIAGGRIETFATWMTGELFAVLRAHSILGKPAREAERQPGPQTGAGAAAFLRGVDAARTGHGLAPLLFSSRTLVLSGEIAAADSLDYLSGLLIGDEIRSALCAPVARPDAPLLLIGEPALCARYAGALTRFGVTGAAGIEEAAVAGLWRIATAAGLVTPRTTETA